MGGLALALLGSIAAHADAGGIVVSLDRARIVKVPAGTQTLIIGNPLVADVTMLKGNGSMVVSGRSFGTTNLISLDSSGNAIDETTIKVIASNQSLVVLRGTSQESYSCNPRCAPTVALGDDTKFMSEGITNVRTRTGAAMSGGK
ncbi:MAG: pilus assembly protein N-terminal domain-containing protein [Rhodoblastus sp.]